jgi:hypothetical protein
MSMRHDHTCRQGGVLPDVFGCEVISLLLLWCDGVIVMGAGAEGPSTPTQEGHLRRSTNRGVEGARGVEVRGRKRRWR